jgi:hypothetical protein
MHDKVNGEKTEVSVMDALDQATKLRAAIEYLTETAKSPKLSAVLWTVQDTAEVLEGILTVLAQGENYSTQ